MHIVAARVHHVGALAACIGCDHVAGVVQAGLLTSGSALLLKIASTALCFHLACYSDLLRRIYATSGRVISGDRRCNSRSGLVRGMVFHVATAVPASASTASPTWCGVLMM